MPKKRRGPGIVKTRELPLLRRRLVELWQSSDYRWRELFEAADVMSEGAPRKESDGLHYYGSTSVLLPTESRGGSVPDELAERLSRFVSCDPHARVRAVRIACLEAQLRSGGRLGRIYAELFVREDERGVRIDVEVDAPVLEAAAESAPGPRKVSRAHAPRKRSRSKR